MSFTRSVSTCSSAFQYEGKFLQRLFTAFTHCSQPISGQRHYVFSKKLFVFSQQAVSHIPGGNFALPRLWKGYSTLVKKLFHYSEEAFPQSWKSKMLPEIAQIPAGNVLYTLQGNGIIKQLTLYG